MPDVTVVRLMKEFAIRYRVEIMIGLGVFALRALYAIGVQLIAGAEGFIAYSDAEFFYYRSAINLVEHQVLSIAQIAPYYPDAFHTPLYSLFLAALFLLKMPLLGVAFVQALLGAAISVFVYKIGLLLSDSRVVSVTAAIAAGIEPMSVYWGGLLMTDVFFAFLLVASFYLLLTKRLIGTAIVLGLAALARPIALLFVPAYLAYAAYTSYQDTGRLRIAMLQALLVFILCAAVVSPWFVRNKIAFGVWEFSSAGWYVLYYYPAAQFAADTGRELPAVQVPAPETETDFRRFDFKYTPLYKEATLSVVLSDTPGYIVFHAERSIYALFSSRYEYLYSTVISSRLPALTTTVPEWAVRTAVIAGQLVWALMYLSVVAACFNRRMRVFAIFVLMLVCINAAISGVINPGGTDMSRYSIGLDAVVFIFAAYGAHQLLRRIRPVFRR